MLLSLCTIKIFARKEKSDAGNGKCPSLRHFFHSSFCPSGFFADHSLKFLAGHRLVGEQIFRHGGQRLAPCRQDLLAARIRAVDDGLDLVVLPMNTSSCPLSKAMEPSFSLMP